MNNKFYEDYRFVVSILVSMLISILVGVVYISHQEVKEASKVCAPYGMFAAGADLVVCFTEDPYTLKIKRVK